MGHEQDEFADFYRASRDSCLRAVTAVIGDRELAEEQVAEAFTRAWMSWGKVRRHAAPRAWVVRTALNTGVSWWRRRREVPLADFDAAAPPGTSDGVDAACTRPWPASLGLSFAAGSPASTRRGHAECGLISRPSDPFCVLGTRASRHSQIYSTVDDTARAFSDCRQSKRPTKLSG
jgi:hypothetical protein